jgi:hypothetical protein
MSRGLLAVEPALSLTEVAQRMVSRDVGATRSRKLVALLSAAGAVAAVPRRRRSRA